VDNRHMFWRSIETAPRDEVAFFWVRPGTIEDGKWFADTSGKPILGKGPSRLHVGKYGTWSSLTVGTHWMPLPTPPDTAAEPK
jgi:hypothetical protein